MNDSLLDELHPVGLREAEDAHALAQVAEGDDDGHRLVCGSGSGGDD